MRKMKIYKTFLKANESSVSSPSFTEELDKCREDIKQIFNSYINQNIKTVPRSDREKYLSTRKIKRKEVSDKLSSIDITKKNRIKLIKMISYMLDILSKTDKIEDVFNVDVNSARLHMKIPVLYTDQDNIRVYGFYKRGSNTTWRLNHNNGFDNLESLDMEILLPIYDKLLKDPKIQNKLNTNIFKKINESFEEDINRYRSDINRKIADFKEYREKHKDKRIIQLFYEDEYNDHISNFHSPKIDGSEITTNKKLVKMINYMIDLLSEFKYNGGDVPFEMEIKSVSRGGKNWDKVFGFIFDSDNTDWLLNYTLGRESINKLEMYYLIPIFDELLKDPTVLDNLSGKALKKINN